ncbi:MAG: hypothetical protein ACMUIM_07700 [bacterium]
MCKNRYLILIITISIMMGLAFAHTIQAQNWQALPPYNILWPLWSPALSPVDPITGVPTPLINELASNTILPVQPILGLNPNAYSWPMSIVMPWFFFNGPTGVQFFDVLYGLNPWPPPSFLDAAGAPIPITLPLLYSLSPLPDLKETQYIFELANLTYLLGFGDILGIQPASLLTFADIWGTPIFFAGGIP